MNIEEAMQKYDNVRLSSGDRWIVWDEREWIVYEHKFGARKTTNLFHSESIDDALAVMFLEGETS